MKTYIDITPVQIKPYLVYIVDPNKLEILIELSKKSISPQYYDNQGNIEIFNAAFRKLLNLKDRINEIYLTLDNNFRVIVFFRGHKKIYFFINKNEKIRFFVKKSFLDYSSIIFPLCSTNFIFYI